MPPPSSTERTSISTEAFSSANLCNHHRHTTKPSQPPCKKNSMTLTNGTHRLKTKASTTSRPATLADVARMAGVVAMTASRAINQSGYVSAEVRQRVSEAVKKLNYRPNMVARQLRVRHLNAIGILLPDIANPFSTKLVDGVRQVFDAAGYATFIATTSGSIS